MKPLASFVRITDDSFTYSINSIYGENDRGVSGCKLGIAAACSILPLINSQIYIYIYAKQSYVGWLEIYSAYIRSIEKSHRLWFSC